MALAVTFLSSAAFVLICTYVHVLKTRAVGSMGQLHIADVVLKSALPGFSLGSEIFLIFSIWEKEMAIGAIMVASRLIFPVVLVYILCVTFLSDNNNIKGKLTYFAPKAKLWGTYMHMGFAREKMSVVATIAILCAGDISLVQMLPWKKSVFHTESNGFPSLSMLRLCLSIKTFQSTLSVLCQIYFLMSANTLNDPTTTPQEKALFGMNISVSIMSAIMGLLTLFLQNSLLK